MESEELLLVLSLDGMEIADRGRGVVLVFFPVLFPEVFLSVESRRTGVNGLATELKDGRLDRGRPVIEGANASDVSERFRDIFQIIFLGKS